MDGLFGIRGSKSTSILRCGGDGWAAKEERTAVASVGLGHVDRGWVGQDWAGLELGWSWVCIAGGRFGDVRSGRCLTLG